MRASKQKIFFLMAAMGFFASAAVYAMSVITSNNHMKAAFPEMRTSPLSLIISLWVVIPFMIAAVTCITDRVGASTFAALASACYVLFSAILTFVVARIVRYTPDNVATINKYVTIGTLACTVVLALIIGLLSAIFKKTGRLVISSVLIAIFAVISLYFFYSKTSSAYSLNELMSYSGLTDEMKAYYNFRFSTMPINMLIVYAMSALSTVMMLVGLAAGKRETAEPTIEVNCNIQ